MKRLCSVFVALFLAVGAAPSFSAEKSISVSGPGCDYKVRFDPARVDERKLKDTANVLLGEGLANPDFPVHPATQVYSEALIKADYAACMKPAEALVALSFLDMPGLDDMRTRRLDQIADTCAFERIKARALAPGGSAGILAEYAPAAPACAKIVEKADDPAALRPVWRALVQKRCVDNANPAQCRKSGLAMENETDADRLIRADVIGYHWTNCAVEFLKLNQDQARDDAARQTLAKEFRKRFRTKETCEDG